MSSTGGHLRDEVKKLYRRHFIANLVERGTASSTKTRRYKFHVAGVCLSKRMSCPGKTPKEDLSHELSYSSPSMKCEY